MNNSNEYLASALQKIHSKNEDFIVLGLTGRTGSGCSTVAEILSKPISKIQHNLCNDDNPKDNSERKEKILAKYFNKNWQPFLHLRVSSILTMMMLEIEDSNELQSFLNKNKKFLRTSDIDFILTSSTTLKNKKNEMSVKEFYIDYLTSLTCKIRKQLEETTFIKLFQLLGRNARRSGSVIVSEIQKGAFYTIAEKTNQIIHKLKTENDGNKHSTYVSIDAIRNPLEASYFQERYASFYLLAISCDEKTRLDRLSKKGLSQESIIEIDKNEYSSLDFDDQKSFTDQDLQGCLQRADIYINSSHIENDEKTMKCLSNQLIKFVSLAQKPGLITPSPEERCMQMAYTAKLNSGCLSRQVGAVVTTDNFSIKSVGWNDTPSGQTPCNLRNIEDLDKGNDTEAYSPFEQSNSEFREQLKQKRIKFTTIKDNGYNHSYCFKTEYNILKNEKNQVHTRSLHAEENAFLQISKDGGLGIEGGFLFTTASPCELCAKKAYQLGMTKIFYIDPYPGISMEHILCSGKVDRQPEMNLFKGAIGRAFHNLYTPITAYKDELNALLSK